MTSLYETLRDALRKDLPAALATIIRLNGDDDGAVVPDDLTLGAKLLLLEGHGRIGSLGNDGLDHAVERDLLAALALGGTTERHYGFRGEPHSAVTVFIEVFAPRARMVIFGAMDFTAALARQAKLLGYKVTVCDARPVFATTARFPMADEVVVDWPHRYIESVRDELSARDALCILTHDPKFDVPAIVAALDTAVGYIGAMGSRRTVEDRNARLSAEGVDAAALARVMAPVGIDIGARTPEETAVSICAEIIAVRGAGSSPLSLRDRSGPIHVSGP